jgi:hypothetical protein
MMVKILNLKERFQNFKKMMRKIVELVLAILHFKSCNTSIKEVALVNFLKNRGIKLYGNM